MAFIGEKSNPHKGFVNIDTTEVELEDRNAPTRDRQIQSGQPVQSVVNELADKWWLWEIVAWSVSLIGLIGVFALLSSIKEKPVPEWVVKNTHIKSFEFKVTINSVISLLATLVKSSLLVPLAAALGQQKWLWFQGGAQKLSDFQQFDAANRGPLGSLILIWSLRGRRLACLGAFIVIASLGLDFSFQQLVTNPVEERTEGTAYMPVAKAIDQYESVKSYAGGPQKLIANLQPSMLSAAYAGIFANGYADELSVTPDCSTGNCTWTSKYVTLGVCSKCYDITSSIQKQCEPPNTDSDFGGAIMDSCTYSLPYGLELSGVTDTSLRILGLPASNSTESTIHFQGLKNPLAIMYLLNVTTTEVDHKWILNSSFAAECALQYCVKKYEGGVSLGKLNETLIDTFFNESAQFENSVELKNTTSDNQFDYYLSIQPPSSWLANVSNDSPSSFTVGSSIHSNLQQIFASSDTCNLANDYPPKPECPQTIFDGNVTATMEDSGLSIKTFSDIPRRIYVLNFTGIETMMENVANGFTSGIRNSKSTFFPTANTPLRGDARANKVIAHVRWGYFAVPATLLVLTLVFMLLTAWETRRRKAMLWKGSSLPAFYYPLTKDGRSQLNDVASPRQMENTANGLKVKWQMTESGMRLVKVD